MSAHKTISKPSATRIDPLDEPIRSILQDALYAPSGDNCQPWKFNWDGEVLRIYHSEVRAKHELNRQGNASLLALGGLLEAIQISASSKGLAAEVTLPLESSDDLSLWAQVRFRQALTPSDPLSPTLSRRCTDRRPFKGGSIDDPLFAEITRLGAGHRDCRIHVRDTSSTDLTEYFVKSESFLWKNSKIIRDLSQWLRLTGREEATQRDGMSRKNIGTNPMEALTLRIIRWIPKTLGLFLRLGLESQTRSLMRKLLKSSAGLICVTIRATDRQSYYEAGRLAYRTWLMLNANGYGVQPLSYASTSVADSQAGALSKDTSEDERTHFSLGLKTLQREFRLNAGEIPVWIFRTGLSPELPRSHRTPRLTLQECYLSRPPVPGFSYPRAFSRNLGWVTPLQQDRLRNSRVAIAGMGGVGGMHLLTLVRLGITKFNIADLDSFEIENFNRQVGADLGNIGKSKVDVMAAQALLINPELDIRTFKEGVHPGNLEEFLDEVDIYVDGLDAFALNIREKVFEACHDKRIPAVTAAPIGMGTSILCFLPGKMSFEQYFGLAAATSHEDKTARFLLGLTPSGAQTSSISDRSRFRLAEKRGPSTVMGCALATGILGTEVLKILLQKGGVRAAPFGLHLDAFSNRLKKTWMPLGHRNPLFRLKLLAFKSVFMRSETPKPHPRTSRRFPVALSGQGTNQQFTVIDVSRKGIGMICKGVPGKDWGPDTLKIRTGDGDPVSLAVKYRWHTVDENGECRAGFEILNAPQDWERLLDRLEGPESGHRQ